MLLKPEVISDFRHKWKSCLYNNYKVRIISSLLLRTEIVFLQNHSLKRIVRYKLLQSTKSTIFLHHSDFVIYAEIAALFLNRKAETKSKYKQQFRLMKKPFDRKSLRFFHKIVLSIPLWNLRFISDCVFIALIRL